MTESGLMTIGEFARSTGLTSSALRFYADSAILEPASIAEVSGYRYYAPEQVDRAVKLRRLREIGMSLAAISTVLEQDSESAAAIVDHHVAHLEQQARRARRIASMLGTPADPAAVATVDGPMFAAAVDQVLTATGEHSTNSILGGVHIEVTRESIVLTATDRYRLSTRTLGSGYTNPIEWCASIHGDDLRLAIPEIRAQIRTRIELLPNGVRFSSVGSSTAVCRVLAEPFPDYRAMLRSLPVTSTRVVVARSALLRAVEEQQDGYFRLATATRSLTVSAPRSTSATSVPAAVTGPHVELCFSTTTMYPALSAALGPDVMLDFSGNDLPVVVRSADDGDLTTLAMPVDKHM